MVINHLQLTTLDNSRFGWDSIHEPKFSTPAFTELEISPLDNRLTSQLVVRIQVYHALDGLALGRRIPDSEIPSHTHILYVAL
jgi:hypothetical protein